MQKIASNSVINTVALVISSALTQSKNAKPLRLYHRVPVFSN